MIYQSLVRGVIYEIQEGYGGETFIPIFHLCAEQTVKVYECYVETFYFLFLW